jgi:hypothetical protein
MKRTRRSRVRERQIQEIVMEACHLLRVPEGIRSVHIVARGRPTYAQLERFQQTARNNHVRLTVDGAGVISVRSYAAEY